MRQRWRGDYPPIELSSMHSLPMFALFSQYSSMDRCICYRPESIACNSGIVQRSTLNVSQSSAVYKCGCCDLPQPALPTALLPAYSFQAPYPSPPRTYTPITTHQSPHHVQQRQPRLGQWFVVFETQLLQQLVRIQLPRAASGQVVCTKHSCSTWPSRTYPRREVLRGRSGTSTCCVKHHNRINIIEFRRSEFPYGAGRSEQAAT